MEEENPSINPLYGIGNYVNKNKLKEGEKIDVQFVDGKYLINGQPTQSSKSKKKSDLQNGHYEGSSNKEKSLTRASTNPSTNRGSVSSRASKSSRASTSYSSQKQSSNKPSSKKEDSINTKHRKICDKLAHFEYLGITVDPDLYLICNLKKAESFVIQEQAKDKLKTKLNTISGILWGTSFVLEKTCLLAKIDSMSGWADTVNKDEKEYLSAAKDVYDKYFESSDSPELKFAMIYAMGILRHTSANKALELLRRLEAATNKTSTNTQAHMRGFTDDEILHT